MQYENGRAWRDKVTKELSKIGIIVLDPYNKPFCSIFPEDEQTRNNLLQKMENEEYDEISKHMSSVVAQDFRCVDLSDIIIAYVNPKVASWGSASELTLAASQKKVTFIAIEGGKKNCPLWLMGLFKHKYFYNSIDEVIDTIKKIDLGEKEIDNERWKLLLPSFR